MTADRASLLFDLFLAFNRRLVSITRRLAPPLTLSESHLLGEIKQHKIINSSLLIKHLHIEKTKVSRTMASFLANGWVNDEVSATDKRVRYFTLTPEGDRVFVSDNQYRNQQVLECLIPLTQTQRKELAHLLNRMADNLQASPISPGSGDPFCKIEIRRLTRALGYLGDNLMGSGMPVDECQVLHLVHRNGDSMGMGSLKELLPYEMTMISRLTSGLEKREILRKKPLSIDKRHVQVLLTEEGAARAEENLLRGGNLLLNSISSMPNSSQEQLLSLLERFLFEGVEPHIEEQSKKLSVAKIKTEDVRQQARCFLIDNLVEQRRHREIQATVMHPDNICYHITSFGETLGVCEISLSESSGEVVYFVLLPNTENSPSSRELLMACAKEAFQNDKITKIILKSKDGVSMNIQSLFSDGKKTLTRRDISATLLK